MPALFQDPERRDLVNHCVNQLWAAFETLRQMVVGRLGRFTDTIGFQQQLHKLRVNLGEVMGGGRGGAIDDENLPVLKLALLHSRRMAAINMETQQAATHHLATLDELDKEMQGYDRLIAEDWSIQTIALGMPRLSDYLTIKTTEETLKEQLLDRQYDEKFGVLQAANLFLPDLRYFRLRCALRQVPVSAAYLDIDDFKKFNTEHREAVVDRALLPKLMETIESHIFMHGYAYRYGGDEYMLLLPNMPLDPAVEFINRLRKKLQNVEYSGITRKPTFSVGLCVVGVDAFLTDREVEDRANRAKVYAKNKGGKDCIATYKGNTYEDKDLYKI